MADESKNDAASLWRFVPVAEYKLPAAPVHYAASRGRSVLRRLLRRDKPEPEILVKTHDDLRILPAWQLDLICPVPNWSDAAESLSDELGAWLRQKQPDPPLVVLVGPPHSGHGGILRAWAEQQGWRVVAAPSSARVLEGGDAWLSEAVAGEGPWVLPDLEKLYLRHASGLTLIRRFLDGACSGDMQRGVIGCESWAWAYLRHVWRGWRAIALTLQSCDAIHLATHFGEMAASAGGGHTQFRQSDSGRYVLPAPEDADGGAETSNYLQFLAGHSRGIFGVARAIWRSSLNAEPDDSMDEEVKQERAKLPERTVWVTPWDKVALPSLPSGAGYNEALLLHTLLLHSGLSVTDLERLLPLSCGAVRGMLSSLRRARVVAEDDDVWQVTPLGYTSVRDFVRASGCLLDEF